MQQTTVKEIQMSQYETHRLVQERYDLEAKIRDTEFEIEQAFQRDSNPPYALSESLQGYKRDLEVVKIQLEREGVRQ
jgi:hypothetical protein